MIKEKLLLLNLQAVWEIAFVWCKTSALETKLEMLFTFSLLSSHTEINQSDTFRTINVLKLKSD